MCGQPKISTLKSTLVTRTNLCKLHTIYQILRTNLLGDDLIVQSTYHIQLLAVMRKLANGNEVVCVCTLNCTKLYSIDLITRTIKYQKVRK